MNVKQTPTKQQVAIADAKYEGQNDAVYFLIEVAARQVGDPKRPSMRQVARAKTLFETFYELGKYMGAWSHAHSSGPCIKFNDRDLRADRKYAKTK